jgi:putative ABC transport system permease protein
VGRSITLRLLKFDEEGKEISRSERMRVVGVLASDNESRSVYVSLQQADDFNRWFTGKRRNPRDGFMEAQVKVEDRASVSGVQAELDGMGFNTFSAQQILEGVGRVFLIMQAVLGGVGAIALLVAAFGIANTMTMAIYERTKEIGIMKAIGATNNDVLQVFLAEAAAIGLFGGVVGVSTGWGVGKLIDLFIRTQLLGGQGGAPPETPPPSIVVTPLWLMAFALAFATLVGLISGIYPALRAANMKPLRALRTD